MTDEERVQELEKKLHILKSGISGEFYRTLSTAIHGILSGRRNALFSLPIRSLDGAFEAAVLQAEIGVLQLVLSLPDIMIRDTIEDLKRIMEESKEYGDNGDTGTDTNAAA